MYRCDCDHTAKLFRSHNRPGGSSLWLNSWNALFPFAIIASDVFSKRAVSAKLYVGSSLWGLAFESFVKVTNEEYQRLEVWKIFRDSLASFGKSMVYRTNSLEGKPNHFANRFQTCEVYDFFSAIFSIFSFVRENIGGTHECLSDTFNQRLNLCMRCNKIRLLLWIRKFVRMDDFCYYSLCINGWTDVETIEHLDL